ncbi:MAG: glycosyltransferase [Rhodobacterales bacterium]
MIHTRYRSNRQRIAFVDPCSADGYDLPDIARGGLGGTEATVLRVAAALRQDFDVTLYQNNRAGRFWSEAGDLQPLEQVYRTAAGSLGTIVVINRWKVALKLRKLHPDAAIYLWMHIYPGRHNRKMGAALAAAGITVIAVSQTHANALTTFMGEVSRASETPPVKVIYNPLADDLRPDSTPRDPNRLLFASSPHKGLAEVFEQFRTLRACIPELTLAVADPGYLRWATGPVPEGVIFLGSLSHPALIRQLRRSLCLFYPQTTFAETFGLVLAEANAVGTPALAHAGLGANDEVLCDTDQRIDAHDPAQIAARIQAWRRNPPRVTANPGFRLSAVARNWTRLLGDAVQPAQQQATLQEPETSEVAP